MTAYNNSVRSVEIRVSWFLQGPPACLLGKGGVSDYLFGAMKKYRVPILAALVLLVLLKFGWDHRPWKKEVFQGYVEGEYVYVASPVSGRLQQLAVHRGESVVPGQSLFQLEPEPERQQKEEGLARARLAEQNVKRMRDLIATQSVSVQESDQSESEMKAAAENLAQIQWKLDQKSQSAKQAAYVQDTFFVQGEWVVDGRPVVSLLPPENIKVRFFVDAATRAKLKAGRPVELRIFGGRAGLPGRISYLSSEAEYTPPVIYSNETRSKLTFLVEAKPDAAAISEFNPGQPVEVVLGKE